MSQLPHTVFLVLDASDEALCRLGLWAVTAASVGERVDVLFCAPALGRLWDGSFERLSSGLSLPGPAELLRQARELAPLRLLSCPTEVQLAGLNEAALGPHLDALVSLPSFWRESRGARIVTL